MVRCLSFWYGGSCCPRFFLNPPCPGRAVGKTDLVLVAVQGAPHNTMYNAHFYPHKGHCFIINENNSVVARCLAISNHNLFCLSDFSVHIPSSLLCPSSAHYTSRSPDVGMWHRRLGHCGSRTILDMARSHVVEGMHLTLSYPPSKCEHCILDKQTRTSIPRVREGARVSRQLERVYIDLCGPMSIPFQSGRLYSMNIIDDFSSLVWSIPLCSKDEAAPMLKS